MGSCQNWGPFWVILIEDQGPHYMGTPEGIMTLTTYYVDSVIPGTSLWKPLRDPYSDTCTHTHTDAQYWSMRINFHGED